MSWKHFPNALPFERGIHRSQIHLELSHEQWATLYVSCYSFEVVVVAHHVQCIFINNMPMPSHPTTPRSHSYAGSCYISLATGKYFPIYGTQIFLPMASPHIRPHVALIHVWVNAFKWYYDIGSGCMLCCKYVPNISPSGAEIRLFMNKQWPLLLRKFTRD